MVFAALGVRLTSSASARTVQAITHHLRGGLPRGGQADGTADHQQPIVAAGQEFRPSPPYSTVDRKAAACSRWVDADTGSDCRLGFDRHRQA
jgi:hypothetical protein